MPRVIREVRKGSKIIASRFLQVVCACLTKEEMELNKMKEKGVK